MDISIIVVFSCTWWVVLYIVLPFGVEIHQESNKGYADSAPSKPMMGIKLIITTLISIFITCGFVFLIKNGYFKILMEI